MFEEQNTIAGDEIPLLSTWKPYGLMGRPVSNRLACAEAGFRSPPPE